MTKEYLVMIENQQHTVTVSDEAEALLAAKAAGRASVGLWKKEGSQELSMTKYLAESWDDLDSEYLEQVVRRHLGLPWTVAQTRRLVIREFQAGDEREMPPEREEKEGHQAFRNKEFLKEYIEWQYGFYGYGIWAVTEKSSGRIVGKAGIINLAGDWKSAGNLDALELGYHIFTPYRRKGYGLEACEGILKWYREHLDCSLYAKIDASNKASIKLAEKLGFTVKDQKYSGSGQWQFLYEWNC